MSWRRSASLVALMLVAAAALAPSPARAFVPPNFAALPARTSWTGTWTTTYGTMHLVQIGAFVSGGYAYSTPPIPGHLSGMVEGATLRLRWVEGAAGAGAGDAWFLMSADGKSFQGSWVKDGDLTAPNAWSGYRVVP